MLEAYIDLCVEHNIHLIADETYALSHSWNELLLWKEVPFISLLAIPAPTLSVGFMCCM